MEHLTRIIESLEESLQKELDVVEIEIVKTFCEVNSEEAINYAIETSIENGKHSVFYVNGILNRFKQRGLDTIDKIIENEETYKNKNNSKTTKVLPAYVNTNKVSESKLDELAKATSDKPTIELLEYIHKVYNENFFTIEDVQIMFQDFSNDRIVKAIRQSQQLSRRKVDIVDITFYMASYFDERSEVYAHLLGWKSQAEMQKDTQMIKELKKKNN